MRIPKYIEKALERREKAAYSFIHNDCIISEFVRKNAIDCEYVDLHCETLCNPGIATISTIKAIIEKERDDDV